MTPPAEPGAPTRAELKRARNAVDELRDAARLGRVIDFRERDPLVLAIHRVIDAAESFAARPVAVPAPPVTPEHRCGVQGFDQMRGDVCPACQANLAAAVPSAVSPTVEPPCD